jgi:hypothetical protein
MRDVDGIVARSASRGQGAPVFMHPKDVRRAADSMTGPTSRVNVSAHGATGIGKRRTRPSDAGARRRER